MDPPNRAICVVLWYSDAWRTSADRRISSHVGSFWYNIFQSARKTCFRARRTCFAAQHEAALFPQPYTAKPKENARHLPSVGDGIRRFADYSARNAPWGGFLNDCFSPGLQNQDRKQRGQDVGAGGD